MAIYRVSGTATYRMPFVVEIDAPDNDSACAGAEKEVGKHRVCSIDGEYIYPAGVHDLEEGGIVINDAIALDANGDEIEEDEDP